MMPFGGFELERLRVSQDSAMPELVTIKRRVTSSDGFGGIRTDTPLTIATDVPARITQAQVQIMYGQASRALELEKWSVRVPHGTNLQDEDFVIWGDLTLQVEDVKDRSWDTCVSARAEIVK